MAITRFNSPAPQPQNLQFFQLPAQLMMQNLAGLQQRYDTNRNLLMAGEETLQSVQAGPFDPNKQRLTELQDEFGAKMEEFLGEDLGRVGGQVQDFVRRSVRNKDLQAISQTARSYQETMQKYQEAVESGEYDESMLADMEMAKAAYNERGEFDRNFALPGMSGFYDYKEEMLEIYKTLPDQLKESIAKGSFGFTGEDFIYVNGRKQQSQTLIANAFVAGLSDQAKNFLKKKHQWDQYQNNTESYPVYGVEYTRDRTGQLQTNIVEEGNTKGASWNEYLLSELSLASAGLANISGEEINNLDVMPHYKAYLSERHKIIKPGEEEIIPLNIGEDDNLIFDVSNLEEKVTSVNELINSTQTELQNVSNIADADKRAREEKRLSNDLEKYKAQKYNYSTSLAKITQEATSGIGELIASAVINPERVYNLGDVSAQEKQLSQQIEAQLSAARTLEDALAIANTHLQSNLPDPNDQLANQIWQNRAKQVTSQIKNNYEKASKSYEAEYVKNLSAVKSYKEDSAIKKAENILLKQIEEGTPVIGADGNEVSSAVLADMGEADETNLSMIANSEGNNLEYMLTMIKDGKKVMYPVQLPTANLRSPKIQAAIEEMSTSGNTEVNRLGDYFKSFTVPTYEAGEYNRDLTIDGFLKEQDVMFWKAGESNYSEDVDNPIKFNIPWRETEDGEQSYVGVGLKKISSEETRDPSGLSVKSDRYDMVLVEHFPNREGRKTVRIIDDDTNTPLRISKMLGKKIDPEKGYTYQEALADIYNAYLMMLKDSQ